MAKTVDTTEKVLKFLTDNKGTFYSRADIEAKTKVAAHPSMRRLGSLEAPPARLCEWRPLGFVQRSRPVDIISLSAASSQHCLG